MKRAAGGGTILGGTYQKNNWDPNPASKQALRIMRRAIAICPELTDSKGIESLDVVRYGLGLSPLREDGIRIEKERIDGVTGVHNYGHGGYGCK